MRVFLSFDDVHGGEANSTCWLAPLLLHGRLKHFASMLNVSSFASQFALLLLGRDKEAQLVNKYYVIANNWTEQLANGLFVRNNIHTTIFDDWI
jgi:hypothetical protein